MDLFDQIHSQVTGQPPAQGDIFDQIHAHATSFQGDQTTPLPQGTEFAVPQAQADETARRRAANEISDRQTGRTFTKVANPDGTTEYHYDTTQPGQAVSTPEKNATYQAQNQQVGGRPMQTQDYNQMAAQVKQVSNETNSPIANMGGAAWQAIAAPVAATVGKFNPALGNRIKENVASTYANNPDSPASIPGRILGSTIMAAPALLGGPQGAALYAAMQADQAAGEARMEVAQRRAQGEQISANQESMYVAGKSALAAATAKISAGAMTSGNGIVNAAATGAADMGINAVAGNAAAIGTGVDPNRTLGEGAGGAILEGGLGAGVGHAVHGLLPGQKPNIGKQIPNEKPLEKPIVQPQETRVSEAAPAEVSKPIPTPESAAPAKPEAKSEHPAELADAKAVGEWYGKTFQDPNNAGTIEAMASMHPGKYKLADVPVEKIDPNNMMAGDTDQGKVDALAKMTPEERAKLPPVIAVGSEGDKLSIADGSHRLQGAQAAGDKTIKAYVPESTKFDWMDTKTPEPTPTKGLPKIEGMEDMTYKQLKDKAKGLGYDTTGKMNFSSVRRAVESQHADSQINLPRPPKSAKDWSAKQYSHWAKESGYQVTETDNRYEVARQITAQRKNALREVAGKNPKAYTPKPLAAVEEGPKAPNAETKTHAPAGVDHVMRSIMENIKQINPAIAGRLHEAEFEGRRSGTERQENIAEARKALREHFDNKYNQPLEQAIHEGDLAKMKAALPPELHPALETYLKSSEEMFQARKEAGIVDPRLENHIHQEVKDYPALQKMLGKEPRGPIKEAWDAEMERTGRPLTQDRKVEIANSVLNGGGPKGEGKAGFRKERRTTPLPENAAKVYKPFWDSQHDYLMRASEDLQRQKFYGRDNTEQAQGPSIKNGQALANTSAGKLITQEQESGKLSGEGAAKIKGLLSDYSAYKGSSGAVKNTRDAINFLTLTHLITPLKQFADFGLTAHLYGVKNTLKATFGKNDLAIAMKSVGLDDVSHEMRDTGKFGKALHAATVLLRPADIVNKNIRATAAILEAGQRVSTPEGEAKFSKENKAFFGSHYDGIVADLKAGKRTWNTDLYATAKLAESQPIYRSGMSPGQARSEGLGRLAYSLKPFLLHQIDVVRREIFHNLATPGMRPKGLKNLASMMVLMGAANMGTNAVVNLITGKTDQSFTEQMANGLLGIMNLDTYTVKNTTKDPGGVITKMIGMPTPLLNDIAHDLNGGAFPATTKRVFKNGKWEEETTHEFKGLSTLRYLPLGLGEIANYWTPAGSGYYKEADAAKKDFRDKLSGLKQAAEDADAGGESDVAESLIAMYNAQAAKDPDKKVKAISGGTIQRAKQTSTNSQRKTHAAQSK